MRVGDVPVMLRTVRTAAAVKSTVPKSLSGRGTQDWPRQVDGASAIHSAEAVSGWGKRRRRLNVAPLVWSTSLKVTRPCRTVTAAVIASPGLIASLTVTGPAGTSSYQAV